MLESLQRIPLPIDLIPEMYRKPLLPDAPQKLRLMAARAALPIPPADLILVLYQLSFDTDGEIQTALTETIRAFDEAILSELAASSLPEAVLDWLAAATISATVLEKIVLNPKTHDATIMDIAEAATRTLAETIAQNHVRLLRSPEIIEKLYLNPNTRMATIDKLLALAKENHIEFPTIKALQDAVNSPDFADDKPGLSDEEFEKIILESHKKGLEESQKADDNLRDIKPLDEEDATPEEEARRLSRSQSIEQMSAPQRVRLAIVGSREDRNILIRDSRRIVYMSVIRSPKMTLGEVGAIAASKNMPDDVIGYIAAKRDWVRYYPIVVSLVNNPKCPLGEAVAFLRQLRTNDLKNVQKSKNIPSQLARQAQAIYKQKLAGR